MSGLYNKSATCEFCFLFPHPIHPFTHSSIMMFSSSDLLLPFPFHSIALFPLFPGYFLGPQQMFVARIRPNGGMNVKKDDIL
jgi:hypothetical protein